MLRLALQFHFTCTFIFCVEILRVDQDNIRCQTRYWIIAPFKIIFVTIELWLQLRGTTATDTSRAESGVGVQTSRPRVLDGGRETKRCCWGRSSSHSYLQHDRSRSSVYSQSSDCEALPHLTFGKPEKLTPAHNQNEKVRRVRLNADFLNSSEVCVDRGSCHPHTPRCGLIGDFKMLLVNTCVPAGEITSTTHAATSPTCVHRYGAFSLKSRAFFHTNDILLFFYISQQLFNNTCQLYTSPEETNAGKNLRAPGAVTKDALRQRFHHWTETSAGSNTTLSSSQFAEPSCWNQSKRDEATDDVSDERRGGAMIHGFLKVQVILFLSQMRKMMSSATMTWLSSCMRAKAPRTSASANIFWRSLLMSSISALIFTDWAWADWNTANSDDLNSFSLGEERQERSRDISK